MRFSLTAFFSVALAIAWTTADEKSSSAQQLPKELPFSELILRMAVEREALVQFSVDCTIEGGYQTSHLKSNADGSPSEKSEVRFEYSKVDKHVVFIYRALHSKENVGNWNVVGKSRNCFLRSDSKSGRLTVQDWDEVTAPNIKGGQLPTFFDPRAVGLGSCGDLFNGSSFENICSHLLNWDTKGDKAVLNADQQYEFKSSQHGATLIVDANKGFWPISFIFAPPGLTIKHEWQVTLGKIGGYAVPTKATLVCSEKGEQIPKTLVFGYHWETVNEAIATGYPAAERIADQYKLPIADRRQKRD